MSVCFDNIYGNDLLKSYFSGAIDRRAMPHALILEGQEGSGRYTFALNIAMAMCCTSAESPCGVCNSCRKLKENISPDLITVEPDEGKASISVDAVRQIKNGALKVPVENDCKFYIIKNSEKMTVQAQNALLKVLEEPPSFVVFILITESASRLLTTIVSRAPVFRMQRFTNEELYDILLTRYPDAKRYNERDPEGFSYIVRAANGSVGKVLSNTDKRSADNTVKRFERIDRLFEALTGNDKYAFISLEDSVNSKKREEMTQLVSDVRLALRDLLCMKKTMGTELLFWSNTEKALSYSSQLTLEAIADMISYCDGTLRNNESNANLNLLKINFMSELWKKAHS